MTEMPNFGTKMACVVSSRRKQSLTSSPKGCYGGWTKRRADYVESLLPGKLFTAVAANQRRAECLKEPLYSEGDWDSVVALLPLRF